MHDAHKSPEENKETERLVDAEEISVDDDAAVAVLPELDGVFVINNNKQQHVFALLPTGLYKSKVKGGRVCGAWSILPLKPKESSNLLLPG